MKNTYESLVERAEQIITEAKYESQFSSDNDIKLYYDLYDSLGELGLKREDLTLYRTRLENILSDIIGK